MSDVFISYSHVDNETGFGQDKGWIDWFFDVFDRKLRQLCGRQVVVWRDHKLDGSDLLTPALEENVRSALLLVTILSETYLQSEWCRAELRLFADASNRSDLRVGTKSRILKVLKTPIDRSAHKTPDFDASDIIGYPFYEIADNGRTIEYDPTIGDTKERQDFIRKVYELVYDAKALLDTLAGSPAGTGIVAPSGVTIYVAESGSDLVDDVESLRRELRQFGHTVLPQGTYGVGPDYEARCRNDMARADVIVSPIGSSLGHVPEGTTKRVVPIQYALALEEASRRAGCLRLVWMPAGISADVLADQTLATAVVADPHVRVRGLEEIKSAVEALVDQVVARRNAPAVPQEASHEPQRREVYLIVDERDRTMANDVAELLYQSGYIVTRPLFQGDETERREDHEDNLRGCDAVLILHASASDFWRRKMLRDVRRALGNGRQRPYLARGLLLVAGSDVATGDVRDPDLVITATTPDAIAQSLGPFLSVLARAQTTAV